MKTLQNKTAVVTGSTSGIGKSIASCLAQQGCNIVLNGLGTPTDIEELQQHLSDKFDVRVHYSSANMSCADQIEEMMHETTKMFGGLDILVNNAGIQHVDLIEDFPAKKWDEIIAINLSSAFHTIRLAIPHMKKNNFGRVINIASAHGLVASAKKSAYVAAKHGIIGLTKVIALETAELPITCNAICPGWVLTPLVQKQINAISSNENISTSDAELKLLSEKQPARKFVQPDDISNFVIFLCSDAAELITGASLSMDGGWTAQ